MTNRGNQDKYDVIQANEEWRQMTSATAPVPQKRLLSIAEDQLAELMARLDSLEEDIRSIRGQLDEQGS